MLLMTDLTSPEAGALGGDVAAMAIVPIGALEQHGPHLPLATDALIADCLARELAERLDFPVLVAPTLTLGISTHHVGFPGTVDLPEPIFRGCVEAVVQGIERLGITRIALFSAHGGNFASIGKIASEYPGQASVIAYDDLMRYAKIMADGAALAGLQVPASDIHAGGLETSQMLYLWGSERIRADGVADGYTGDDDGWLDKLFADGVESLSPNGILGRPTGATAHAGELICHALVDELERWIVARWPGSEASSAKARRRT